MSGGTEHAPPAAVAASAPGAPFDDAALRSVVEWYTGKPEAPVRAAYAVAVTRALLSERERSAAMERALVPVAAVADVYDGRGPLRPRDDADEVQSWHTRGLSRAVTVGMLRAARAALATQSTAPPAAQFSREAVARALHVAGVSHDVRDAVLAALAVTP